MKQNGRLGWNKSLKNSRDYSEEKKESIQQFRNSTRNRDFWGLNNRAKNRRVSKRPMTLFATPASQSVMKIPNNFVPGKQMIDFCFLIS